MLSQYRGRSDQLARLALRHKVPAVFQYREFAAAGGLTYGRNFPEMWKRAVQREVAVAIAGRKSSSETHKLGLDCDWRLTKRYPVSDQSRMSSF